MYDVRFTIESRWVNGENAQNFNAELTKIFSQSALREAAENLIAFGLAIPRIDYCPKGMPMAQNFRTAKLQNFIYRIS